jgi:spore coat polysaccharide biosynthesis protein SpsF (cytidylyltransferase family)
MGSFRLPEKALADIGGRTLTRCVLDRVAQIVGKKRTILAVPSGEEELGQEWDYVVYGSEYDVLSRFMSVHRFYPDVSTFVRFTGDCPLLDVDFSRLVIDRHFAQPHNITASPPRLDGLDTEVFTRDALLLAHDCAGLDRQHVTRWMRQNLSCDTVDMPRLGPIRWSVDDASGLDFARRVYAACRLCRLGYAHHSNAGSSIGGDDRSLILDLHVSTGGGLEECTAADILQERIGPQWLYQSI